MKNDARCPRCQSQVFYRIERAEMPNPEYSNSFATLGLTGFYGESGESGFMGPKMARKVVTLEAWVCAECGGVELFTPDLDVLEECAHANATVTRVDRTGE
mgnify:CR=1 FL=1